MEQITQQNHETNKKDYVLTERGKKVTRALKQGTAVALLTAGLGGAYYLGEKTAESTDDVHATIADVVVEYDGPTPFTQANTDELIEQLNIGGVRQQGVEQAEEIMQGTTRDTEYHEADLDQYVGARGNLMIETGEIHATFEDIEDFENYINKTQTAPVLRNAYVQTRIEKGGTEPDAYLQPVVVETADGVEFFSVMSDDNGIHLTSLGGSEDLKIIGMLDSSQDIPEIDVETALQTKVDVVDIQTYPDSPDVTIQKFDQPIGYRVTD